MITSRELLDLAKTLVADSDEVALKLLDAAVSVRHLESKEIMAQSTSPSPVSIWGENMRTKLTRDYAKVMEKMMEDYEPIEERMDGTKMYKPVYKGNDPALKAEEELRDDSEKWAKEFLTAPTDTSLDVAEEWRKKNAEQQRKKEQWDEDTRRLEAAGVPTGKPKPKEPLPDQEKRNKEWDAYLKRKVKAKPNETKVNMP